MALFNPSKRSALQRLKASEWKDPQERDALLVEARAQAQKPADFVFLLSHADQTVRQVAGRWVRELSQPGMLEALLDEAESKPEAVRKYLLRLTQLVLPEHALPSIEAMLGPGVAPARQRLGWQLALELPPEQRRRFVDLGLKSANGKIRSLAIQRYLEDRAASDLPLETLVQFARDPDERVRAKVLETLETGLSPEIVDVMLDRLQHDTPALRTRALNYLGKAAKANPAAMEQPILSLLVGGDDDVRQAAIQLLLSMYPVDRVMLRVLELTRGLLGWMRARILRTMKGFASTFLPTLAQLLGHPEDEVRMQALVLAESLGDARLVIPVARLLRDPDWWLRIMAADCLGQFKDPLAIEPLMGALEDPDTKWAALEALARIGTNAAVGPVVNQLNDPRPEVKLEAVSALASFPDERLVPILKQVIQQETSQAVVTRATEVLRTISQKLNLPLDAENLRTTTRRAKDLERPLDRVLARAREVGASDVHINVGESPWMRVLGEVRRFTEVEPLSAADTEAWLLPALDPRRKKLFEEAGEVDFCHQIPEVGRYRANLFTERRGVSASFRTIPNIPPTIQELRLPTHLKELTEYHQGLVVVSGPAGCGKSTTLAALINLINESRPAHVITLEDPIEFVHPVKTALINQREVGRHTRSFARALRGALREDPDVIVVQEMRDAETIRLALTAAETGHLVFTTLHTTSATQTVDRLVDAFPPEEQQQVRMALSESLKYVVCQTLIPRVDGRGRVGVYEILKGTPSVGNMIREAKTVQLTSTMQIGRGLGMRTVDMALEELLGAKLISPETAYVRAEKKELFEGLLGSVGGA
ncbi:MAG: PilT/PilU family type 4a pilus ATPase [Myxococcota bacterium]